MFFTAGVRSIREGRYAALLMTQLKRGTDKTGADAMVASIVNPSSPSVYFPQTQADLRSYMAFTLPSTLYAVDGAYSTVLANALWNGYSVGPFGNATDPVNAQLEIWAATHVARITQNYGGAVPSNLLLVGYSAGGAVILRMIPLLLAINPNAVIDWHTFGSPKIGGRTAMNAVPYGSGIRWMTDSDPIPIIPPDVGGIGLALGYSNQSLRGFVNFHQPRGGVVLKPNGVPVFVRYPPNSQAAPLTSVVGWLTGLSNNANNIHNMDEYYLRMVLYANSLAPNLDGPPPVAAADPGRTVRLPNQTVARSQAVTQVFLDETRQNATPVTRPSSTVFTAVRKGKVWVVLFGIQEIAISGRKKSARQLARLMNAAFVSLQRQAVVHPDTFDQVLQLYFQLATSPTGGFTPVMNTQV